MLQAIRTTYHGPTDTRGSRVKATADRGSIMVAWDRSIGVEANHRRAAQALADKFGWAGRMVGGSLPGRGYVFVFDDEPTSFDSMVFRWTWPDSETLIETGAQIRAYLAGDAPDWIALLAGMGVGQRIDDPLPSYSHYSQAVERVR